MSKVVDGDGYGDDDYFIGTNAVVRMSRSGRVIKPRMASWLGQRILYDCHGTPLRAEGIITSSMHSADAVNANLTFSYLGLSPPSSPQQEERTFLKTKKRNTQNSQNPRLVDYSESSMSSSGADDSAVEVLTPLCVKKNKTSFRKIASSPEEVKQHLKITNGVRTKRKKKKHVAEVNNKKTKVKQSSRKPNLKKNFKDQEPGGPPFLPTTYSDVDSNVSFTDLGSSSDDESQIRLKTGRHRRIEKLHKHESSLYHSKMSDRRNVDQVKFCRNSHTKEIKRSCKMNEREKIRTLEDVEKTHHFNGNDLQVSRSGRVVKPRLASWAGQRIAYNIHGSPIRAVGVTTESVLSSTAIDATAIATYLGIPPPQIPCQHEGRSSKSSHSDFIQENSMNCDITTDSISDALTPIHAPRNKGRLREISSSDESDDLEFTEEVISSQRHRIKKNKCKLVRKRRKPNKETFKRKKKKNSEKSKTVSKYSDRDSLTSSLSDIESNVSSTEVNCGDYLQSLSEATNVPRKWKKEELDRLKLALNAIKPSRSEDWEKVSTAISGGRTAEECREIAIKKLCYLEQLEENVEDEGELKECAGALFKTKVGSLSYLVQAQRFTRKFILCQTHNSKSAPECFDYSTIAEMPSVAHFDPDDSLLDVLRTPKAGEAPKANHREFIPKLPGSNEDLTPKLSLTPDDSDWKERDRKQRYVHQLLRSKRNCMLKRANDSTRDGDLEGFPSLSSDLILKDAVQKLKAARRNFDNLKEDEEEEKPVSDDGIRENNLY